VVLVIAQGLRRARRWAWICALVLLALNILAAALLAVIVTLDVRLDLGVPVDGETAIEIGSGLIALVLLVYLIVVRAAFSGARRSGSGARRATEHRRGRRPHPHARRRHAVVDDDVGRQQLPAHEHRHRRLPDPCGGGDRSGRSLGPEGRAASVAEFIAAAEEAALIPASSAPGRPRRRPCRAGGAHSSSPTTPSSICPGSPTPASGGTRCARPSTAPDARR
jgi:hypothetical protein